MSKFNLNVSQIHRRFYYKIERSERRKERSILDLNILSLKDFPTNRLTTSNGMERNEMKSNETELNVKEDEKSSIECESYTKITNISAAIHCPLL